MRVLWVSLCTAPYVKIVSLPSVLIKMQFLLNRHYMSFGLSYFFYDIYAMYVVFKENESEETESSFTVR